MNLAHQPDWRYNDESYLDSVSAFPRLVAANTALRGSVFTLSYEWELPLLEIEDQSLGTVQQVVSKVVKGGALSTQDVSSHLC